MLPADAAELERELAASDAAVRAALRGLSADLGWLEGELIAFRDRCRAADQGPDGTAGGVR